MRILIACECSGIVRDAFRALGHDAWSCDLLPSESGTEYHLQCDVLTVLHKGWDLMIAHPECTYLTCSAEWAYKDKQAKNIKPGTLIGRERRVARVKAAEFFMRLWQAPIKHRVIENPVGVMSRLFRKPDQIIQPHQYGHDASKATCLWLSDGIKPLEPTDNVPPRIVTINGRQYSRWANQTDGGQNRLPPSATRSSNRSRTYIGIARAMADQWGML